MTINIYSYKNIVNLVNSDPTMLENTQVFHDKLTLYKNLDNIVTFRIRNKDRVHQTFTDSKIVLNIVDTFSRLIEKIELDYTEENKRYTVKVEKDKLLNLNNGIDYKYFVSVKDIYTDQETPLFTDHINSIFGNLEIVEPYLTPYEETYNEVIDITPKKVHNTKYWAIDHIVTITEDIKEAYLIVPDDHYYQVTINYHTRKYSPINIKEEFQWKEYLTFHDVTGEFKLPQLQGYDMKYIITVKNLVKPDIGIKVIRYPSNDLTPQLPML